MKKDQEVRYLNYLCRTYDGINKLIVSTKNRIQATNPEAESKHQDEIILMESLKGKVSRKIEKQLAIWPVWTEWMKGIKGIGPYIAGFLIMLYYYRMIPVCPECGEKINIDSREKSENGDKNGGYKCDACGKKLKGEGLLKFNIEEKDFPKISAWWSYMGEANDPETGKKQKKKKGSAANWSHKGRLISYQIGESFVYQQKDHPYKNFYLERKQRREKTHPDASKMYRHNMARREAAKLFLSHFWQVARTIDGKEVTEPYAGAIMGHTNIVQPFMWEMN